MATYITERERVDVELELLAASKRKREAQGPVRERWQRDPVAWLQERLKEFAWSKQREILNSLRDNRRTAVPSAHEVGKSFIASRAVCWWLDVWEPGEAFVVTTAPTAPQVRAILWREINRAHKKGNLPGTTNQTEWWLNDEIVAFGRKPADYSPAAFQGIHAKRVLVVIDEAGGVPETIYHAATSLIANEYSRILAIGNPDDPSAYFERICRLDSGWNVIPVDGLESPNFTGEEIPDTLKDLLISHIYVEEMRHDVGDPTLPYEEQTSPIFKSKVRGQFPEDTADGVISLSAIRKCQVERELTEEQLLPVEIGFDVGAGGDAAVVRERRGMQDGRTERYYERDAMTLVGRVVEFIKLTGATAIKIDVIGIGWAVAGRLEELQAEGVHTATVHRVNVGEGSTDPVRFPKLRDQLWWEVGHDLIGAKGVDLRNLDDVTIAQLIAPTWKPDSAGRIKVEPKDETKKRIHRSPDDADAWILAHYVAPSMGIWAL